MTQLSPDQLADQLEQLRQSGIRIDRDGEFWHEGATVTHRGLKAAFWRWLDLLPDGRFILRLDDKRFVYVTADDAPLVVRSLRWHGDSAIAVLNDGSEERVDFATLSTRGDSRYLHVRRKLPARLSPGAWNALGPHLEERNGQVVLRADGVLFPL